MTDHDRLVRSAARGDGPALTELIQALAPGIHRYLAAMLGAGANDAMQEVFVRMARSLDRYKDGIDDADSWAYGLARRIALDRSATATAAPLGTLDAPWRALDPEHRDILVLRDGLGWDTTSIARVLGESTDDVTTRLAAARTALRPSRAAPSSASNDGLDHAGARALASALQEQPIGKDKERDLALHLVACTDCKGFYESLGEARNAVREASGRDARPREIEFAATRAVAVLRGEPDPGPRAVVDEAETTGEIRPSAAVPASSTPVPSVPVVVPAARVPEKAPEAPQSLPVEEGERGESRRERRERRREAKGAQRRGPWVAAIAATLVLAVLAALIVTQGPAVRRRFRSTPSASEIRRGASQSLAGLRSFTASFRVVRLGLWRQDVEARIVYAFTNATQRGRVVFESPDKLREEVALEVPGAAGTRSTRLSLQGAVQVLDGTTSTTTSSPALGPPDGPAIGRLGILEPTLGSAVAMLQSASDVIVTGRTTVGGRAGVAVRFNVAPDEYSRADRIDMVLDEATSFPLRVERSIGRRAAGVLGPPTLLSEAAIDTQFAGRERVPTETVELSGLSLNEPVLPGEFVLAPPDTAMPVVTDERWERVSRGVLEERAGFRPLYPASAPAGFRETAIALYSGRPKAWGPRGSFPAADGALQIGYGDGTSTVVVTERKMSKGRERVTGSPIATTGLPVSTSPLVREGRQLTYGIGPDVPPHVWGFVGDVFVMAAGWAPKEVLIKLVASLLPAGSTPAPAASAAPGASAPAASAPAGSAPPGSPGAFATSGPSRSP